MRVRGVANALDLAQVLSDRTTQALDLIARYGGIDGDHHKAWVLDQVVRVLTGDDYDKFVAYVKAGEDGPDTYSYNEGIAP